MSGFSTKVGELRPTQMLFSYGVGSIVDLPNLSVMVMGLEDWDPTLMRIVSEDRLLAAVQRRLGPQVKRLLHPPIADDSVYGPSGPLDEAALQGVPVAPFPRWMVCSSCRHLASLADGVYELKPNPYRVDQTRYFHKYCKSKSPTVFPARFMAACRNGHLDDFPWNFFVHRGTTGCHGSLQLFEVGPSGEARGIIVKCKTCGAKRSMSQAFGDAGMKTMPRCRHRRVHLKDVEPQPCDEQLKPVLIGASNLWFPASASVVAIPVEGDRLDQLVAQSWDELLFRVDSPATLQAFLGLPALWKLQAHDPDEIWAAIERKRNPAPDGAPAVSDLKRPEWDLLSDPRALEALPFHEDFRVREVGVPGGYEGWIERVVLADRLREVRALVGFTRIASPGELGERQDEGHVRLVPLSRHDPEWVPATEVRGEGIFIHFREEWLERWLAGSDEARRLDDRFREAHRRWREVRGIRPAEAGYAGLRYVFIHSLAHALMRQLSLECGYTSASIRERLYVRGPHEEGGPMAGMLLYTAAPDSQGTLGGLVAQGEPGELRRHLDASLRGVGLCASDPLCAEHTPNADGHTLHGAACHACLFAAETSCEAGNRYLDRTVLVDTVSRSGCAPGRE